MPHKVLWNGTSSGNEYKTSGLTVSFARGDAVTGEDGQQLGSGDRRYAPSRLLCGAPTVTQADTSGLGGTSVWSGRWSDGSTPCIVQYKRDGSNAYRVIIRKGAFSDSSPYLVVNSNITGTDLTHFPLTDFYPMLRSSNCWGLRYPRAAWSRCRL